MDSCPVSVVLVILLVDTEVRGAMRNGTNRHAKAYTEQEWGMMLQKTSRTH